VRNGFITLGGEVEWNFQKEAAERALRDIEGVKGVANVIAVKPKVKAEEVKRRVEQAIKRAAELDARAINVTTRNGTVELHGTVHSLFERRLAENAAKAAPGVKQVENDLVVLP
jgi:osmotically-inducible protein OsmY